MSEINVRLLGEDDWSEYRAIRLRALKESPEAFVATHEEESGHDEDFWRMRMRRSRRLLAERDGTAIGVVSVGSHERTDDPAIGELFGLWVQPQDRGTGVARRLLEAAASQARKDDMEHLAYWVGTDNGRAVAFASSFGFRPTDSRRPMRVQGEEDDAEEAAMVLPLGSEPGSVPSTL